MRQTRRKTPVGGRGRVGRHARSTGRATHDLHVVKRRGTVNGEPLGWPESQFAWNLTHRLGDGRDHDGREDADGFGSGDDKHRPTLDSPLEAPTAGLSNVADRGCC